MSYIAFHPSMSVYGTGDTPETAFQALKDNTKNIGEELPLEEFPSVTFHTFDPVPEDLKIVIEPTIVAF